MELSIINQTKKIIDETTDKYYELNNKYYNEILQFLNKLFNENSESILKIKFKKIIFNDEVLLEYNNIINKYNLNKNIFDIENFNINDISDFSDIVDIIIIICNNLLDKLNYQIFQIYINNKKKLKIKIKN
jgi:virulence-associated protein VapD